MLNKIIRHLLLTAIAVSTSALADVPALTVNGNKILSGGEAKSFAGNSFFWSNTGWEQERWYNADTVRWLKNDWNATIVRAAMGVDAKGGYLEDQQGNISRVRAVVDAAIAEDMYVLIDFHTHHGESVRSEAIAFFEEMARTYGNYNNVIYEIYNEPLRVSWDNTIKPYAEAVISAIRKIDPDNLIVVGTPSWSQDVDAAARNPVRGYKNIAYTLHFYAGTHGEWLRSKARSALSSGIALFVTEWGTVNADGDGAPAVSETEAWMNFLKQNDISHLNWSVSDKAEGASIVYPGTGTSGWNDSQLTASGRLVKKIVSNWGTTIGAPDQPVSSSSSSEASSSSSSYSSSSSSAVSISSSSSSISSSSSSSQATSSKASNSGATCEVTNLNQWGSGYQMDIAVINNGTSTLSGWTLSLNFDSTPRLSNSWNADISVSGNKLIAKNIGWNGNIGAGQSTSFGFQGNSSGYINKPTCTLQ